MQALKRAAAVFCIACICAELLAQMTDRGWARRCIKTVAGLYILVVFWNALPQLQEREAFSLPQIPAASMGSLEDLLLAEAESELEQRLAAQCAAQTGVTIRLSIVLSAEGKVDGVRAELPAESTAAEKAQVQNFLENALGTTPILKTRNGCEEAAP